MRSACKWAIGALWLALLLPLEHSAQTLPDHGPVRILIVSDEVNPHGLGGAELTQPGDLSAALLKAGTLNIDTLADAILEIATNEIELATAHLNRSPLDPMGYDLLIYFSHRIPNNGNKDAARQESFVSATQSFLESGGGVISFHHGIYRTPGKQSMQTLLGAEATGSVPFDTQSGQNVLFVGDDHFIGNHEISYEQMINYENIAHGVSLAQYPAFNNTPDERYPFMDFVPGNDLCDIRTLFESNYVNNGPSHLLGYTKWCPGWQSEIFAYQPGEYQPNALAVGNNFQILLNAIYYLTTVARTDDVILRDSFEPPAGAIAISN